MELRCSSIYFRMDMKRVYPRLLVRSATCVVSEVKESAQYTSLSVHDSISLTTARHLCQSGVERLNCHFSEKTGLDAEQRMKVQLLLAQTCQWSLSFLDLYDHIFRPFSGILPK